MIQEQDLAKIIGCEQVFELSARMLRTDWRIIPFFDRYLGRGMRVPAKELDQAMLPCVLACNALSILAQRSGRPQPQLTRYVQHQFQPLQLQRFLRSCVFATARALASPPATVCRLVHARTRSRWIDCIFVRVMSGFAARAEVRRQAARLCFACAGMD